MTRVLVVEDEESYSDALAYMLRKEGFEVGLAATGPDALLEFDRAGEYASADVEAIRVQLRTPGWSRIVGVHSKRDGDNVEVFTWLEGGNIAGLAILCADPTELVVVNIVGAIDLEKLSQLEGKFGIPKLNLEKGRQHE